MHFLSFHWAHVILLPLSCNNIVLLPNYIFFKINVYNIYFVIVSFLISAHPFTLVSKSFAHSSLARQVYEPVSLTFKAS